MHFHHNHYPLPNHKIIENQVEIQKTKIRALGKTYVILPLFSTASKEHEVSQKSGLNQWNAGGRARDPDEVYIPIPSKLNSNYPDFFPDRDVKFVLHLPNGESISAKVCQDNRKALMSDPNKALGHWILRDVLQLPEGELVTMSLLNRMGFDSVIIYKDDISNYRIDVCRTISYSDDMFGDDEYDD